MEEIFLNREEKALLRTEFGVAYNTLNNALKGKTNGPIARLLRKRALEMGGVVRVVENKKSADELTDDQNNSTYEK